MIGPGYTIDDFRTGTRTTVLKGNVETNGTGWVLEVRCPPGAPPHILEHLHTTWNETFEILSGEAHYKLAGRQLRAGEGDTVLMPAGQPHVHPWNAGETEMVYRQVNDFGGRSPDAAQDVLGVFVTINGLAREGKLNKRGLPKNPLQFAATLRTLTKHGGFDATAPVGLQKLIAGTLGRIAEALGYRGSYEKYIVGHGDEM